MDLKPGVSITARLRLVRLLGKGGMGSVWVAYHETLKTEVAVKFIEGEAKSNPKTLARFEREAEIAAKLKSLHVAQMYDHGTLEDGTPYIVMELLEGESLQDRLKRGPLSLQETAIVISQAAKALGKAHKLGIIHRDVKPGNLFLLDSDYDLFIKLLDFGIAKAQAAPTDQELTKTGNLLGSPLYMSPEQFAEIKRVDHRADLWSLAVVAYRCLTSAPPFTGEALGNLIIAVVQRKYRPITDVNKQLPATLDEWFAKAFHMDLDKRFQSAKELATSFIEIAHAAASPGEPRVRLPSITETTHTPQPDNVQPEVEKTAELPNTWRGSTPPESTKTLQLNGDVPELAEAATFAPAANTIDEDGDKKRAGIFIAAAAAVLAIGAGSYVMLSGDSDTNSPTPATATIDEQPEPTNKMADNQPLNDAADIEPQPTVEVKPDPAPTASVSATAQPVAAPKPNLARDPPQPAPTPRPVKVQRKPIPRPRPPVAPIPKPPKPEPLKPDW